MKKRKKFGIAVAAALVLNTFFASFAGMTSVSAAEAPPEVEASAAFVLEPVSGKVLLNQNGDEKLGIASMTKMITEYLLFETVESGEISWDQQVPISEYAYQVSQNYALSNVPLRQEETYSVEELYHAMAVYSANGATIALAELISGSEPEFVDRMREKVESWGITEFDLYNATGLSNANLYGNIYPGSAEDAENSMTARGIAIVAQQLLTDFPQVLEVSSIPSMTFREGTEDQITMDNWNWMLEGLDSERENVDGLKTGTTNFAGATFTGTAEENGMRIITVVMNVENGQSNLTKRFDETAKLMDWAFANWEYVSVFNEGDAIEEIDPVAVDEGKEDSVDLRFASDVSLLLPVDTDLETLSVSFLPQEDLFNEEGELTAPVEEGTEVGSIQITSEGDLGYADGTAAAETPAETASEVERANVFVLAARWVKEFFGNLFGS